MDGRAGGDGAQVVVGEESHVEDYLHRTDGRAVVEGHKLHVLVASAVRTQPITSTSLPIMPGE